MQNHINHADEAPFIDLRDATDAAENELMAAWEREDAQRARFTPPIPLILLFFAALLMTLAGLLILIDPLGIVWAGGAK